ncbi:MAG: hypothetical protein IPN25_04760 [Sphingobacteriales bacterium]|nr:hypothetical protein [Sphingobacteriales bacterium]MBK6890640.1 hypothetical protein [Sphingobacteriales bacterium]MBK8678021.1 hypothetical protein [Sphingobacteriales bacterium]MBL0247101.1 hypothetical protein [Sphingobacteriales bacterium]HMS50685.1 hypothetical protein [Chitinophagales bacterium]
MRRFKQASILNALDGTYQSPILPDKFTPYIFIRIKLRQSPQPAYLSG